MDFWYYLQQPHVRKAAHIGNRTLSDGVDIYRAMLEDTMQSVKPQLIEVMENYKVGPIIPSNKNLNSPFFVQSYFSWEVQFNLANVNFRC